MINQNRKTKPFEVDRTARAARRGKPRTVKQTLILQKPNGEMITRKQEYETSPEDAEARQILLKAARSFIGTIEFIKPNSEAGNLTMRLLRKRCNVMSCDAVMLKVSRSKK